MCISMFCKCELCNITITLQLLYLPRTLKCISQTDSILLPFSHEDNTNTFWLEHFRALSGHLSWLHHWSTDKIIWFAFNVKMILLLRSINCNSGIVFCKCELCNITITNYITITWSASDTEVHQPNRRSHAGPLIRFFFSILLFSSESFFPSAICFSTPSILNPSFYLLSSCVLCALPAL